MGNTYFFTGYPGYIATYLIKELFVTEQPVEKIYALVLPSMMTKAEESLRKLVEEINFSEEQIELIPGDITKNNLDMSGVHLEKLQNEVSHVFHLAAIYDLAVPFQPAWEVNVEGTRNVNDFIGMLNQLKRYIYFSTAYVAGKRQDTVYETDLEHHTGFKNFYEETKYEAERYVQSLAKELPVTIIRPGIVVGHSETGETLKFDGPYFILNMFQKLRFLPIIPYIGKGDATVNIVPIDYVIQATVYLAHLELKESETYHLTDPNPYTARELYAMFMDQYLNQTPTFILPTMTAKMFLSIPGIRKWLRVEKEALDYFTNQCQFDPSNARKRLRDSNIECPDFQTILPNIVSYYKEHEKDPDRHILIR
ncbi:thioester reductase-like protein [Melghiribacillus thermohalophilus]|uniref:Thioester reductase-like protein n=1 Tax=Melghiribacillus thermohalophilus TaxID=1324956 RepID=A0A4R3MVL3_9BACI|nr:SDR family oxidoreductase [Melghiribacillus thermohalophilus]TCT20374.1 thioester reductase-like protein [Melghiribacillus thermohalophilus]